MIRNIQCISYLGYNKATNLFRYEFKIIDDDFEWEGVGTVRARQHLIPVRMNAIINCYSKNKLPIAPNLVKALFIFNKQYGWSIEEQINWNKQYCPNWHLVEKDMDKYLLLV